MISTRGQWARNAAMGDPLPRERSLAHAQQRPRQGRLGQGGIHMRVQGSFAWSRANGRNSVSRETLRSRRHGGTRRTRTTRSSSPIRSASSPSPTRGPGPARPRSSSTSATTRLRTIPNPPLRRSARLSPAWRLWRSSTQATARPQAAVCGPDRDQLPVASPPRNQRQLLPRNMRSPLGRQHHQRARMYILCPEP